MIGNTISHYTILEKLGEGGMGVVYRAHDSKLDRDVAIKFLPERVTSSATDRARFIQEARAAAALNHQNICSVIDIEESDGKIFIVMELVDGQTLREKIGTVTMKQAIDIGIQIADGLAAAHDKGIVHRDIKPENVMVRKDGRAQIMDFGLAKLQQERISRLTKEGSTIGTAGYMSPEQVQGQDTDHRSDIFSLGVVLYELFTGQMPFKGVHETAILYEIVNVDAAPMNSIRTEIDPGLDAIVLECLEKDPNERTQSARQVAIDLKRFKRESTRQRISRVTTARPVTDAVRVPAPANHGDDFRPKRVLILLWLPWILAALFAICLVAVLAFRIMNPALPVMPITAQILPPEHWLYNSDDGGHIALSPDGSLLAFAGRDSMGKSSMWLRRLDNGLAHPVQETEGAEFPFWSPDSRSLGFFSSGKLKRVDIAGGQPFTICDAPNGRGGTWNRDGIILFSPRLDNTGIVRVQASGGDPVPVTRVDTGHNETNHRWPQFLPDGRHFIFTTQAKNRTPDYQGSLFVASLDDTSVRLLSRLSTNVAIGEHAIVFVRKRTLMMQSFDTKRAELVGDPVPLGENVNFSTDKSRGMFTASANGMLIYQATDAAGRSLFWFDRNGKMLGKIGDHSIEYTARIHPNGRMLVYDSNDRESQNIDVWLYDLTRNIPIRFTFDHSSDGVPAFSPDGSRIVFYSDRSGSGDLYLKNTGGTDNENLFLKTPYPKLPCDWSPDGHYILMASAQNKGWDLEYCRPDSDPTPRIFLQSEFNEDWGRFSPDGRWVVYESDESGKYEIYVRPFPGGGGKWQVSADGGYNPTWSRSGREIFFMPAGNAALMSAEVDGSGGVFHVGAVRRLFLLQGFNDAILTDASADGNRFLIIGRSGHQAVQPLTLLTNWDRQN